MTPGGQTATMEAMSAGVPVAFLPSYNLSQTALVQYLKTNQAAPLSFDWQDMGFKIPNTIEKEAIVKYKTYTKEINRKPWLRHEAVARISELMTDNLDDGGQHKFIKSLGFGGAEEIATLLKKVWRLS